MIDFDWILMRIFTELGGFFLKIAKFFSKRLE